MAKAQQTKANQKVQSAPKPVVEKKYSIWLSLLIVFIVPVVLYFQTTSFGLTHFDDDGIITNNMSFLSNMKNIPQAFANDAYVGKTSEFYRPLQTMSYMLDVHFSNTTDTWMFHLTNVLLFGLLACLLFLFLLRFSIPSSLALASTVLYCANPLFTSTVAWIPARGDLLLTIFSLLTFILFIDYLRTRKMIFLFLHWISFTIALYCKETAAFLPFLMLLYFLLFTKNKLFEKSNFITIILYTISGFLWFWMRSKAIGDVSDKPDLFQVGFLSVVNSLRIMPEAVTSFFMPLGIAVIPGFSTIRLITGLVLVAIMAYFIFKNKSRLLKEQLFCILWFLLLLVPTMFFRHLYVDFLCHRFILPFIGIILLILFLLPKEWIQHKANFLPKVMIAIAIVFCFLTVKNLHSYASPSAFYDAAIAQNPNSSFSYNNRGTLKFMDKDYQGALDDFTKAASVNNTIAETYLNIALSQSNLNNFKDAIPNFDKYIQFRPNKTETYVNKGMALGSMGDFNAAIACFTKAISLDSNLWGAYGDRAIAKFQIKDYKGAIVDCDKVLQLKPNEPRATEIKSKSQELIQK
jgi:protein O-mannosyl-transferase